MSEVPDKAARCGTCGFATHFPERPKPNLCCWRYPPTIHRKWFRFVELYPSVFDGAICGEYRPAKELANG